MKYQDLEIWKLASEVVGEIHKFLRFSLASNDETHDHLETLFLTGSLKNEEKYHFIIQKIDLLGKMLNRFIKSVEKNHRV